MYLEVLSPERRIVDTEIDSLFVPGVNGRFQILKDHAPIVSLLAKGDVRFYAQNEGSVAKDDFLRKGKAKGEFIFDINGGTLEVSNNKITMLVD